MKKLLIILLPVIVIAVFMIFSPKNQKTQDQIQSQITPTPVDILMADMTSEFSKKYNKSESDIEITTQSRTEIFAKGLINFKDEPGGAVWFAVKVGNTWKLAFDGQGPMNCELAEKYSFPKDLVPSCIDPITSELIER